MAGEDFLAGKFEENRGHLRGVAYRMLGSLHEADDAVQEAWLRLSRSDANAIDNLGGWLTTVVARVCLDMLRARSARREDDLDEPAGIPAAASSGGANPEQEAIMAESVGIALLVVLNRLAPAERLAFVLHDLFAVPFEEIASITGRSETAARQLASRARRRVQGAGAAADVDVNAHRKIAATFLDALRGGDVNGLLAVLDPDLVVRLGPGAGALGGPAEIHGAENWARGAVAFAKAARYAQVALVDGNVGLVLAPRGRLFRVVRFLFKDGRVTEVEVIADAEQMRSMEIAVVEGSGEGNARL